MRAKKLTEAGANTRRTAGVIVAPFVPKVAPHDLDGFDRLAELIRDLAGIHLPPNEKNVSLVAGRLQKIMKRLDLGTFAEYNRYVRSHPDAIQEFVNALTTNLTGFFRENAHFDVLAKIMTDYRRDAPPFHSRERDLRVWCAAASTGQEPYTILMTLLEATTNIDLSAIRFLATDIDLNVLAKASAGVYETEQISGIAPELQAKYLRRIRGNDELVKISKQLRESISFAQLNLVDAVYPFSHQFHIIFCRNVLIYFDPPTQAAVIARLTRNLRPGGYLFLGHSETGAARPSELSAIAPAAYRKASR